MELKEFLPSAISSSGNICGTKLGIAEVSFASPSSEAPSLEYSTPGVQLFKFGYKGLDC